MSNDSFGPSARGKLLVRSHAFANDGYWNGGGLSR